MSYATEADLIAWCGLNAEVELTELTDPNNRSIDSDIVVDKLNQADREIDARLPGTTLTPPYPQVLVDIACRIARYLLYTTGRPDYVTADYEWALQFLADVRKGEAVIVDPGMPSYGAPAVSAPAAVFSAAVLATMP